TSYLLHDTSRTQPSTLSLHDALPIYFQAQRRRYPRLSARKIRVAKNKSDRERNFSWQVKPTAGKRGQDHCRVTRECLLPPCLPRSEEHTSELQSLRHLVCRLLLEKKT